MKFQRRTHSFPCFASLAGAMVMTGGPVSLAKAWVGAIIGM